MGEFEWRQWAYEAASIILTLACALAIGFAAHAALLVLGRG